MHNDLAGLVGSRICHDLISPIGAISNGVELLSLTDGDKSAEMDLISESVENANARIRFFRLAYGAANADSLVSRSEVLSVLSACARGGRYTYFWQVEDDTPRGEVRIAFLLLQCFEAAMPTGGDIHIARKGSNWIMSAVSDKLRHDQALWAGLTDPQITTDHSAAQVQFALLPGVIAEARRSLILNIGTDRIEVRF
jgi:histidine phosphotransferase ChpT